MASRQTRNDFNLEKQHPWHGLLGNWEAIKDQQQSSKISKNKTKSGDELQKPTPIVEGTSLEVTTNK